MPIFSISAFIALYCRLRLSDCPTSDNSTICITFMVVYELQRCNLQSAFCRNSMIQIDAMTNERSQTDKHCALTLRVFGKTRTNTRELPTTKWHMYGVMVAHYMCSVLFAFSSFSQMIWLITWFIRMFICYLRVVVKGATTHQMMAMGSTWNWIIEWYNWERVEECNIYCRHILHWCREIFNDDVFAPMPGEYVFGWSCRVFMFTHGNFMVITF